MTKRVAVLMGGWSGEREVSLVTGRECSAALREAGYVVTEIDVRHDLPALLKALTPRPDAVFIALHGTGGEDGTIQGVLDFLELPYTHSGLLASALALDKPTAKRIFAAAGLRCPEGRVLPLESLRDGEPLPRPYVLKPTHEGSSLGVLIVREGENAPLPSAADWPFGRDVLAERFIPGREITVAVMGDRALGALEIRPRGAFYDYTAKYAAGGSDHLSAEALPPATYAEALDIALRAHRALGCRSITRADLRWDDTGGGRGELYLLEVNTQPGMTPTSLVPEIAAAAGYSFPALVAWMVEEARCGS
ncbi:MAG: D-alanine--D-alanine ligase [Alphaproteobacteria bacterium]|nr:D-alanine--D-alanine ligase [Alphaproteobacteria bacterium]